MIGLTADDRDPWRVLIEPFDYLFERIGEVARPYERAAAVEQGGDRDGFVRFTLDFALIWVVPARDANNVSHVFEPFFMRRVTGLASSAP